MLWTVVECGIGIIAGSLPMLGFFSDNRNKDKEWEDLEVHHYGQDEHRKTEMGRTA